MSYCSLPPTREGYAALEKHAIAWSLGVLLAAFVLLFTRSMGLVLDHDEHQFVASAALLARRGLLPYRDYPYFHTPYLIFVDAVLFRCTHYLLTAARGLSAACGAALVWLVYRFAGNLARRFGHPPSLSTAVGLCVALVLLTNPLFLTADGLAWNHDAAELLMMGAALLVLREMGRGFGTWPMAAAGMLAGGAIGIRLTGATAAIAILGFLAGDRHVPRRRRVVAAAIFLGGLLLALTPLGWFYWMAPQQFYFGNFDYPALNTAWRQAGLHHRDATPIGKILVFATVCFSKPENLLLLLTPIVFVLTHGWSRTLSNHPLRREMNFLGFLILFLLIGSFAASPSFGVYFYAPLPFLLLWMTCLILPFARQMRREALSVFPVALLAAAVALGIPSYLNSLRPSTWIPVRAHALGIELSRQAGAGATVLTLAPIFPLEGGLDIYPAYATGPFAMRIAGMVPENMEPELDLNDPEDLPFLFRSQPPRAMLGGVEGETEAPLVTVAQLYPDCKLFMLPEHWQAGPATASLEPLQRRNNKPHAVPTPPGWHSDVPEMKKGAANVARASRL